MRIAEFSKAIVSALSAAVAVEATGLVTGVADHYLTLGIGVVVAVLGAFGITYQVPNKLPVTVPESDPVPSDEYGAPLPTSGDPLPSKVDPATVAAPATAGVDPAAL